MPAAARAGDPTNHPGVISPQLAVLNVLIEGRPAAVQGTLHICALPPLAGPHPQTPIASGSSTVLIGGRHAARMNDKAGCGAVIIAGATSVLIGD